MKFQIYIFSTILILTSCTNSAPINSDYTTNGLRPEIINIIKAYIDSNQMRNISCKVISLEIDSVSKDTSSYLLSTIISTKMFKYYPSNYFYIDTSFVFICDGSRDIFNHNLKKRRQLDSLTRVLLDTDYHIYDPIVWKLYTTEDTILINYTAEYTQPVMPKALFNPPSYK